MRTEEEEMMRASNIEEAKRAERLEKERKQEMEGGTQEVDKKYKALEHLLSQSKVYAAFMLEQIQKQEEKENAADEKSKKTEEKAEKAAEASQRRSTRQAAAQQDGETEEAGKRGRGRPKKEASNKDNPKKDGKISDYIKKEDVQAEAGKGSLSDALKKEEKVRKSDIRVQQLRSARQPEAVTGGIMRSYQLEGLEWLISLYENGLNGILADEMGLGKTIQTIAFLAFLREKQSFGPFLIAAPLSTTSNWVDEFRRWTPDIPVVLYHGSKQERAEIRQRSLKNPGSEHFPVVCTSYEICMNDRKFLAGFGWKFIIIVSP